ncbi:trypsin-1-like [Rhipicephalus microplus]|uniref:trypsin-1-like n=1 Tax=Rhipicephalus microplus TaxID=6941 RepID=UPI0018874F6B|nr:LOW QUALITY PROTEIN: trypsin-1-like [Rhipicephalus microplus]
MFAVITLLFVAVTESNACGEQRCGVRGPSYYSQHQRIVGGEQAGRLEFPWQISLRRVIPVVNQDRGHACGGSIINSRYVLTAAHCVTGLLTFPSDFTVVVGEEDITKKDDTDEAIQVRKIIKHPQWDKDTMENDYALLELKTPLDFEGWHKHLMPICLPEKDQDFVGQNCTISGWGLTKDRSEGGKVPAKLQKVDVPVLKHSTCIEFYKDFHDLEVKEETMICAGYEEGGRSACQGDSGGPLQCARADGRYVLAGATSWGLKCAAPRKPGVYARIATRVDWIRSVVGETP